MLFTQSIHLLPLVAGLVGIVAQAEPLSLKQATRASILERSSRTHRKRDAPSGIPPTSAGSYYLQGERYGYRGNNPPETSAGPPYSNDEGTFGPGITLSQALQSCSQQSESDDDNSFNIYYTPANDQYVCLGYSAIHNANILTTEDNTLTYSYVYSKT